MSETRRVERNKAICHLILHLMQKSKWHMAFSKRAFLFSSRIITLSAVGFHITDKEKLCSLNCRAIGIRRRPTLPDRYQSSTIGTEGLNFCVRYGNRWDPFVIATGNGELFNSTSNRSAPLPELALSVVSVASFVPFGTIGPFHRPFLPLPGPSDCLTQP